MERIVTEPGADWRATLAARAAPFAEAGLWIEEVLALDAALASMADSDWVAVTGFKGWLVRDHVHHLTLTDRLATLSAADADRFRIERELPGPRPRASAPAPDLPPAELLAAWRTQVAALAATFADVQPSARLPWFGPDMSARAFIVARLMETWSHGQTIHDAVGLHRTATDRLKPICELGWRTFGWSFTVRGLEPPTAPISLQLIAPGGALWRWGAEEAENSITGPAEDFALVVCQCRNIADTRLQVQGAVAQRWMAIAQCFAGAANDPPAPGTRVPHLRKGG